MTTMRNRLVMAAVFGIAVAGRATATSGPLAFEANRGQVDARVRFLARGAGYTAFLTQTEALLRLGGTSRPVVVRMQPVAARHEARLVGERELPGLVHDRRDATSPAPAAATWAAVRAVDVQPGVDLVYYGDARGLEYDVVVAPGTDVGSLALAFDGVERLDVDDRGVLVAHTAAGELRQPPPVAYQEIDGVRRAVSAAYVVDDERHVRFRVGDYDRSSTLVIDPLLTWSTYLGGSADEADEVYEGVVGVATDAAGNVYVTGTTESADFPTTAGVDGTYHGMKDVFVTKFSPSGAVLYSTYLGGPCDDTANDIVVDAAGDAYVTGSVNGGQCYDANLQAGVLVAKLGPTGAVVYASVFGGSLADTSRGEAIAVDGGGHAYVTGVAMSATHDFPTTPGAFRQSECSNVYWFAGDGFVAKLSADGSTLDYSTILCGSGDDAPSDIAIDASGAAYVAGTTASGDFPLVAPLQGSRNNGPVSLTGFVAKLSPDGSHLVYSTYLGGSESEAVNGIAVDAQGAAYVTGETLSDDFPTTPGVLQEHGGNRLCITTCSDAFVSKIAPDGATLAWSTYLYGELDDSGEKIAVDAAGNPYVVGITGSANFPVVAAFQANPRGLPDAFVSKLSADGSRLVYSSYLGGSHAPPSSRTGWDAGTSIAIDAGGRAYVAGYTQSYDFPTTPGAFQPALAGPVCDVYGTPCGDAFVAKIGAGGPGVVPAVSVTATPSAVAPGGTVTATWTGIPAPGANDELRLYALGSPDGYPGEILGQWKTTGTAGGTLALAIPDGLPSGWYEVRLFGADPVYPSLLVSIARSEPIHVGGTTTTTLPTTTTTQPPTTTTTLPATCGGGCDDGDPCTVDACVPGVGCVSTPAVGFASVTCTCERADPAACAGESVPTSVDGGRDRACALFRDAASTTDRVQARRRLKRGAAALKGPIRILGRSHRNVPSPACRSALGAQLQDAMDRAARLVVTVSSSRAPGR